MSEEVIKIDGKEYKIKYPHLLREYLQKNCRYEEKTIEGKTTKELADLATLAPIAVGIIGGAFTTWLISREQKEKIVKEYCA